MIVQVSWRTNPTREVYDLISSGLRVNQLFYKTHTDSCERKNIFFMDIPDDAAFADLQEHLKEYADVTKTALTWI